MPTASLSYSAGTPATAPSLSCAAGEAIAITVTMLASGGAARDCTGGKLRVSYERRGSYGAPLSTEVSADSTGIATLTIPAATTRSLDANYVYDVWFEPATGDAERVSTVGVLAISPAVGPNGDLEPNAIVTADIADVSAELDAFLGTRGGTTANRPSSPGLGQTYYDTTLSALVVWTGSTWATV